MPEILQQGGIQLDTQTVEKSGVAYAANSPQSVDQDGMLRIRFQPPSGVDWRVHRMLVQSSVIQVCKVYITDLLPPLPAVGGLALPNGLVPLSKVYVVSGTNSGDFDENSDNAVPYYVPDGWQMIFEWPNASDCVASVSFYSTNARA